MPDIDYNDARNDTEDNGHSGNGDHEIGMELPYYKVESYSLYIQ